MSLDMQVSSVDALETPLNWASQPNRPYLRALAMRLFQKVLPLLCDVNTKGCSTGASPVRGGNECRSRDNVATPEELR
jgi:hypothetical protein